MPKRRLLLAEDDQKGAESSINELVKHKNDEIKIAAIQCIVDFHFKSAVAILKRVFWNSLNIVKMRILNTIATLGSKRDILFLEEVAKKENSFIVVGKVQSTINVIAPETILPSKDIAKIEIDPIEKNVGSIDEDKELKKSQEEKKTQIDGSIKVGNIEFFDDIELPEQKKEKHVPDSGETDLPPGQQSIFYSLYHYTDEIDAKLILLEELEQVGDKKEIPFLEQLLLEKEKSIVKRAEKAIDVLTKREEDFKFEQGTEKVIAVDEEVIVRDGEGMEQELYSQEDDRIPMELFLLYEELGIESSNQVEKESWPFDFELSHEFFLGTSNNAVVNKKKSNE